LERLAHGSHAKIISMGVAAKIKNATKKKRAAGSYSTIPVYVQSQADDYIFTFIHSRLITSARFAVCLAGQYRT
jgi:hypothetical protein